VSRATYVERGRSGRTPASDYRSAASVTTSTSSFWTSRDRNSSPTRHRSDGAAALMPYDARRAEEAGGGFAVPRGVREDRRAVGALIPRRSRPRRCRPRCRSCTCSSSRRSWARLLPSRTPPPRRCRCSSGGRTSLPRTSTPRPNRTGRRRRGCRSLGNKDRPRRTAVGRRNPC
jgi:hypothetical protein